MAFCLAASLSHSRSATGLPVSQSDAGAVLPPWLRGLVSSSKAASLGAPGLGGTGDSLAALALAFPAWLAQTGEITSAESAGGAGGAADAGLGGASLGDFLRRDPLLPPLATDPPLLRDLENLENVRSAQRLEDAVAAFLHSVAAAAAAEAAAAAAPAAEAASAISSDTSAMGSDGGRRGGGAEERSGSRRAAAVLAGVQRWLDSELEQLAAAVVIEWDGSANLAKAGGAATAPAAAAVADDDLAGGGAAGGGGGGSGAGGGGSGRAGCGGGGGAEEHRELEAALGHPLASGLSEWLRHAARHPLPVRSKGRDAEPEAGGRATGGAAGMGAGQLYAGDSTRPPGPLGAPAAKERGGGGGKGGAGGSGRRRLQQNAAGGDGGGDSGGGGSGNGAGGPAGGGGGAPAGGSLTWVEPSGIQGFNWRDVRPLRDAVAGALLNQQKPRTRATERLLQLHHIVQRDLLDGNVPFTGGRVQRWCDSQPFVFTPRVPDALPEEYIGPSFFLTRASGNCALRPDIVALGENTWTQLYERLACLSPSLQYLLLPAVYNGRGDQPESFSCPQCAPVKRFGRALDITYHPMEPRMIRFTNKRAFLAAVSSNATSPSSPMRLTRGAARRATSWLLRNLRSYLKEASQSAALAGIAVQADLGTFATAAAELLAAATAADASGPGPRVSDLAERVRKALLQSGRSRAPPAAATAAAQGLESAAAPLEARRLPGATGGSALAEAVQRHAGQQQRELEKLLRL